MRICQDSGMPQNGRDNMRDKGKGLTQNQLKIIAALTMLMDHVGAQLFPQFIALRIVGRLSFPVFSFCIYEGYQHTHSKSKYLLRIALLGILCIVGYYIFSGEIYANVLITFSLSICCLSAVRYLEERLYRGGKDRVIGCVLCMFAFAAVYVLSAWLKVDYGFCGVVLPVFAELVSSFSEKNRYLPLIGFFAGVLVLSIVLGGIQYFSIFALPLLFLYNGDRGKVNMKSFFYWFYPVHLAVIGLVSLMIG